MGTKSKSLLLLAGFSLAGCIYVTPQPAAPPVNTVSSNDYVSPPPPLPPPVPAPVSDGYVAPPLVQYQPPPPEVAPVYQDDLAPYGRWIVYGAYGRCWVPNDTPYGWQPYTVGHWVYSDDGSCYWVSEANEVSWGGIVYHYGQWAYTGDQGWIWVPGTTYAPAWVAWRDGGGYCGWAPLPPEACYGGDVSYVVADHYCPPDRYVFVQEGDVNVTRVDERVIRNNTTIINRTTNITNITVVNNRVINNGVPVDQIEHRTGRQITRVNVADAGSPDEARRLAANGVPVHYSNPAIEQIHTRTAPHVSAAQLQHDQEIGQQRQQQLNSQVQTDRQLQSEDKAAHQQQVQLDQQIQQQHQADQTRQRDLNAQVQEDKRLDHQQEVDNAKQAEVQKQIAHQQEIQQQDQARAQQAETERQQREQQAAAARQEHDQQVEAQRQAQQQRADAERQAAADREAERQRQADLQRQQAAQNQQGQPGNGDQPRQHVKAKPGQDQGPQQ